MIWNNLLLLIKLKWEKFCLFIEGKIYDEAHSVRKMRSKNEDRINDIMLEESNKKPKGKPKKYSVCEIIVGDNEEPLKYKVVTDYLNKCIKPQEIQHNMYSTVIGVLRRGEIVNVIEVLSNGWFKLDDNSFVQSKYLTKVDSDKETMSTINPIADFKLPMVRKYSRIHSQKDNRGSELYEFRVGEWCIIIDVIPIDKYDSRRPIMNFEFHVRDHYIIMEMIESPLYNNWRIFKKIDIYDLTLLVGTSDGDYIKNILKLEFPGLSPIVSLDNDMDERIIIMRTYAKPKFEMNYYDPTSDKPRLLESELVSFEGTNKYPRLF